MDTANLIETEHAILSSVSAYDLPSSLRPTIAKITAREPLTLAETAAYRIWLAEQIEATYQECECEACAGGEGTCEARNRSEVADAWRDEAIDALRNSDEPRAYIVRDDNASWTITSRPSTLATEVEKSVSAGDWGGEGSASWVWSGDAVCEITGESERFAVPFAAVAPPCRTGRDHDWQAPHEVVGGLVENPGVFGGDNGGIRVIEVCAHCGRYKIVETRKTNPGNGTTYEGLELKLDDAAVIEIVEALSEYECRPKGDDHDGVLSLRALVPLVARYKAIQWDRRAELLAEFERARAAYVLADTMHGRHRQPDLARDMRTAAMGIVTLLGHHALVQGHSYECSRCGATGGAVLAPVGTIFDNRCTGGK